MVCHERKKEKKESFSVLMAFVTVFSARSAVSCEMKPVENSEACVEKEDSVICARCFTLR